MRKHSFAVAFISIAIIAAAAFPHEGYAQADSIFQFQEYNTRAILKNGATVVVFRFGVNGNVHRKIRANVSLAWLDPRDNELSKTDAVVAMNPRGQSFADVEIPFPLVEPSVWTRLKYSITPEASDDPAAIRPFAPVSGIVSLSSIAKHAFELRAGQIGIGMVRLSDGRFSVFAEAVSAGDGEPVHGIKWDAELSLGDKLLKPAQIIKHDEEGFAEFVFDFSEETAETGANNIYEDVTITGRLGDFIQSVTDSVTIYSRVSARRQTNLFTNPDRPSI